MSESVLNGEQGAFSTQGQITSDYTNGNIDIEMNSLQNDVSLELGNIVPEANNLRTNTGEEPHQSSQFDKAVTHNSESGTVEKQSTESQKLCSNVPSALVPDQTRTQVAQQDNITTNKDDPGNSMNPPQATALPVQVNAQQSTELVDKNKPDSSIGAHNSIHPKSQTTALPVQIHAQQNNAANNISKPGSSISALKTTNLKSHSTVLPHQNNLHQNGPLIDRDEVDKGIGAYKTKGNKIHLEVPKVEITKKDLKATKINIPEPDKCLFCLDEDNLIHMCSCSALAHKECALEYIRFPGRRNEDCCQCRKKLEYSVMDKQTPMENKYIWAFFFLIIVYLAMIGLSIYSTTIMISKDSMNYYVWLAVIANLSILWPLLIVYLISLGIDCCCGPRNRMSDDWCRDSGCYCSGDCGVGNDCGDCGDIGEGAIVIVCVICLIAILIVLIAASAYLVNSLVKLFKSFSLKSKKKIVFKHEKRLLNTLPPKKMNRNLSV